MRPLLAVLLTALLVAVGGAAHADARGGRTAYHLKSIDVADRAGSSTVVGNGGTVRLRLASFSWTYYGSRSRPHLVLQRDRGDGWRTVDTASFTVPKDLKHDDVIAWTQPYSTGDAAEAVRYRFLSKPYSDGSGTVTNRSATPAFTVRYENQARYTGTALAAYQAMQQYCPTAAVRIGGESKGSAGTYTVGTQLIRLMHDFSDYSDAEFRSVALHECGHLRQWVDYGSTPAGDKRMEKAAKRIFIQDDAPDGSSDPYAKPFDPVEHAADCGARAVEPNGYLGYGGWCDDAELAAGLRVLQGGTY